MEAVVKWWRSRHFIGKYPRKHLANVFITLITVVITAEIHHLCVSLSPRWLKNNDDLCMHFGSLKVSRQSEHWEHLLSTVCEWKCKWATGVCFLLRAVSARRQLDIASHMCSLFWRGVPLTYFSSVVCFYSRCSIDEGFTCGCKRRTAHFTATQLEARSQHCFHCRFRHSAPLFRWVLEIEILMFVWECSFKLWVKYLCVN